MSSLIFVARRLTLTTALAAGMALGLGLVGPSSMALAQGGGGGGDRGGPGGGGPGGFGGMFGGGGGMNMQPTLTSRDVDRAVKMLGLDKDQEDAVKALLESYQQSYRDKAQPVRDRMDKAREDFRETRDPSVWTEVRKETEKFRPIGDQLTQTFMNDMKSVLNEQQAAKFPSFERALRRNQTMNRGLLSGERVDLVALLEKQEIPEQSRAEIAPLVEQYEIDLDRELQARTKVWEELMPKMGELMPQMFAGGGASKELQEIMDKGRDAGMRVRDVNRRYARQISGVLPDPSKTKFDTEFERESYPMAFRDTRISRQLTAVAGFADLTGEQKESITQLTESFNRESEVLTRQLIEATDKMESTVTADQLMTMFRPGGNDDSPVGQVNRKRRDLNQATQDKLQTILTPEQVKRLPQDDRGGRGGPGGNNQDQQGRQRGRRGTNANDAGGDAPAPAPRRPD
ncbi:MAG: hypothetical protein IT432_08605 [Phycisphaerales bacterium]|nr:hypothetical protein [Phycisphaerales bacterium]